MSPGTVKVIPVDSSNSNDATTEMVEDTIEMDSTAIPLATFGLEINGDPNMDSRVVL